MQQPIRTRQQAYELILANMKAGITVPSKTEVCAYKGRGKRSCAIGGLLTPAQLKDIQKRNLNTTQIDIVAQYVGRKNIEYATGLTVDECSRLQSFHDSLINRRSIRPLDRDIMFKAFVNERLEDKIGR